MARSSRGGSSLAPGQIYSQPALTGAGIHNSTVLVTALDSLKAQRNPVRLEDFALTYGLTALIEDESLRQRFKNHPRVEWNAKLDLWSYKVGSRAYLFGSGTQLTQMIVFLCLPHQA